MGALHEFPKLLNWLSTNYAGHEDIGPFRVFRRRDRVSPD
jgi:hypothetical protein